MSVQLSPGHRVFRLVFAFGIGLLVAWYSYVWITNPDRTARRAHEEAVVLEARQILQSYLANGETLELSDPLNRVREAGKVYIYPVTEGWELSGQYRRPGDRLWHSFLMRLDENLALLSLSVQDADDDLVNRAAEDSLFSVRR